MRAVAFLSMLMLAAMAAATQGHDPFWPIGYRPKPTAPVVEAVPVREQKPRPKPLPTSRETRFFAPMRAWDEARKTLNITGTAVVRREGQTVGALYVNGRGHAPGETVSAVRDGTRFIWRVCREGETLLLRPLRAERLPDPQTGNIP